MKRIILISCLIITVIKIQAQGTFNTKNAHIAFFSETPMENIDAATTKATAAINVNTKKIAFNVPVKSFKFKNGLMQEHFNENYMESDKFPSAFFEGVITDNIDISKPGSYDVTIVGKLTLHGITRERTIKAHLEVSKESIIGTTEFKVKVADHKIPVPELLTQKIAEEVKVTVNACFTPKK